MKWFRVYSEIKDDPKMLELDDHQRWLWLCLLAMASESTERGCISGWRKRGLAATLRTDEDRLTETIGLLVDLDMIEYDEENHIINVTNWMQRQYDKPSDTPTATRERKRQSRQCHADVTPSHATDTDTDTEKEKKKEKPVAALPPPAQTFLDNGGKWPVGKLANGTTKKAKAIAHMVEYVGSEPKALAFWGRVVAGYCAQWSSKSYRTMINNYFLEGKIPGEANKNNRQPARASPSLDDMEQQGWDVVKQGSK